MQANNVKNSTARLVTMRSSLGDGCCTANHQARRIVRRTRDLLLRYPNVRTADIQAGLDLTLSRVESFTLPLF